MRIKAILVGFLVLGFTIFTPPSSMAALISVQSHLWLAADSAAFSDYIGSPNYVGDNPNPWLAESMVINNNPFNLYIYNASSKITAYDVGLIVTVHSGETGTVTIGGTTYSDFPNSGVPFDTNIFYLHYAPHGIWEPAGDGVWTAGASNLDITPRNYVDFGEVSWAGFSKVHFDAFSTIPDDQWYTLFGNGNNSDMSLLKNPYSHDLTAVPEPGTMLLLGSGLIGMAAWGRKKFRK